MSQQVRSKWRIGISTVMLLASLGLVGFCVWSGFARGRWHWGLIILWALWGFWLYPAYIVRELRKPKELVQGAPDPKEPNLSLFQ